MPLVHVDTSRVQQVLINLIENALKYTKSGNSVEVKINNYLDGQLCIFTCRVIDSGSGIEPENQTMIFKPCFLNDELQRIKVRNGYGLGLNICLNII